MSLLLQWSNRFYLSPLYSVAFMREHPRLHGCVVGLIDCFFVLLALALLYAVGLVPGWGIIGQFRMPKTAADSVVIFVLAPVMPGWVLLVSAGVLLSFMVAAVCGLLRWCGTVLLDPEYVRPSTIAETPLPIPTRDTEISFVSLES
jgi:hypothetical protein